MQLDIDEIANISKLTLSKAEREKFQAEFQNILGFIKKMENTTDVPVPHLLSLDDLRDDEPREGLSLEDALSNAPKKKGRYFVVPQTVE